MDRGLRPIHYQNSRGSFKGWFHGWDDHMNAVIEVPDGNILTATVGRENEMIFLDRAEAAKKHRAEEERVKSELESNREKRELKV